MRINNKTIIKIVLISILSLNISLCANNNCTGSYYSTCKYVNIYSVDHSSGYVGAYANYFVADIDAVYDGNRNAWGGLDINVYIPRLNRTVRTVLWTGPNGGSVGDGKKKK